MIRLTVLLSGALAALAALTGPPAAAQDKEPKLQLPKLLAAKPLQVGAGDDELRKLLKERYNAALAEARARYEEYLAGKTGLDGLVAAFRRLTEAGLDVNETGADRMSLRTQFVEVARAVEKNAQDRHEAGRITAAELAQARYLRLDAEVQLLRARQDASIDKKK